MAPLLYTMCSVLCVACGGDLGGRDQEPDTVVANVPIAYIKRTIPLNDPNDQTSYVNADLRNPYTFRPGAALWLRDTASPSASERNITAELFPMDPDTGEAPFYDVRDVSVADVLGGLKLVFSVRAPEIEGAEVQPTWNIYTYDLRTHELSPMLNSAVVAEAGQDIQPQFLPNGDILFASSRQHTAKARLLDEGKAQYNAVEEDRQTEAAALHVYTTKGELRQLTFNPSHDLYPQVRPDGRILFVRWDNFGNRDGFNLYSINPDGTGQSLVFGWHSHDLSVGSRQYGPLKMMPDGTALVSVQDYISSQLSLRWETLDYTNYVEADRLADGDLGDAAITTEGAAFQTALALNAKTSVTATPALEGRLHSLSPLGDGTGRFLVSWSPCRVLDPEVVAISTEEALLARNNIRTIPCSETLLSNPDIIEASPRFSLWITDESGTNFLPIVLVQPGEMISEAIAVMNPVIPGNYVSTDSRDSALVNAQLGILDIRSVYDIDGQDTSTSGINVLRDPAQSGAEDRPARFLRLEKMVPLPSNEVLQIPGAAFGRSTQQLMREIIGYAPVEPDGSVRVHVPANVAFTLSVLDANGRRLGGRHQNWLQVQPGETRRCQGCHEANSTVPHGRLDALPTSAYVGAESDGPFPNSVSGLSAVLGETMAQTRARILGDVPPEFGLSYDDIWTDPAVRTPDTSLDVNYDTLSTPSPLTSSCADGWDNLCRILIHYEKHIHPLWSVDRRVFDAMDVLVVDNTCTRCHGPVDDMNVAQVPAAQLDLTDGPSADQPAHFAAYWELLFGDNEQEVVGGVLMDRQIPVLDGNGNPVFETDENGDLIVDANGDPIPVLTTVGVSPSISLTGARASRFFSPFANRVPAEIQAQVVGTVDHRNMLSDAELKLLSEWVDIGAQYYNDPFAVPQND